MSNNTNQPESREKSGNAELFSDKSQTNSADSVTLEQNCKPENQSTPDEKQVDFQPESTENLSDSTDDIIAKKSEIHVGDSDNASETDNAENENQESKSNSSSDNNSTAVFTFSKELPEGISHEELNLSELEDTAKSYFIENHSDSIEDKVNELCRLADAGFEEDEQVTQIQETLNTVPDTQNKNKKKKKKKDVISNDDMEMLAGISNSDTSTHTSDNDELDENLLSAFGMSEEKDSDFGNEYDSLFADDEPEVEYTDPLQETLIIKDLRSRAIKGILSVILTLAAVIFCGYFESAAGTSKAHPAIFEPGRYGIVYSLSMLQIMFFGIIFNLDGVKRAFLSLNPYKARPEGLTALTLIACTLHSVLSITLAGTNPSLKSYCTIGCLSLLMLSINSFIKSYTALTSFCIAASKKPKFSTKELDATSAEAGAFAKYLEQDTTIFTVSKNSFISGFFKKIFKAPNATLSSFKIAVFAVISGIVCGVLASIFGKNGIYGAVNVGFCVTLAALPVNMLLATALPHFISSLTATKSKTAFIGEAACDAYTEAGILSFDDTEVFPPNAVKVSSIRTYGENRIDKVIIYMARIFEKLEGPLSRVFANSVQGSNENIGEAQIIEHCKNGIRIKIDGKEILIGTSSFFKLFDIITPADNIDESFLQSLGSIMYMSVDGELAAKFYIKYTLNVDFENILKSLYDSGICVGVKTLDPCINNQLICGNLKGTNYPISIIQKELEESETDVSDTTSGSIVTLTGIHSFLRGFISLDKLRSVYRSNTIVATGCSIISMAITAILTLSGSVSALGISYFIILQLLWCLPTVMFSFLNK